MATTEWENISAYHVSDSLVSRIYKELLEFNDEKTNTQLKSGQRIKTDGSPKKTHTWLTNKHTKCCLISLVVREMQIKR